MNGRKCHVFGVKTEKNLAALLRHSLQNVNGSFYFKTMQFMMFRLQYLAA